MTQNFYNEEIAYEPKLNLDDTPYVVIKNGSPELINGIEAIRQWILKFSVTEKDVYPIYEGTGFGTRIKSLFGHKKIGYGYEESELERDYREGLPLCPAISQVEYFDINKNGKVLNINLQVQLYDSALIDVSIEKAFVIKG